MPAERRHFFRLLRWLRPDRGAEKESKQQDADPKFHKTSRGNNLDILPDRCHPYHGEISTFTPLRQLSQTSKRAKKFHGIIKGYDFG